MERVVIKKDFHGYYLDDALQEVELIIGKVRSQQKTEEVEFITGHGVIRKEIVKLLCEYGLEEHQDIGNSGIIIATIE